MEDYRKSKCPEERAHILSALGAAPDKPTSSTLNGDMSASAIAPLQSVIDFCLDRAGPVRDQDKVSGLRCCAYWSPAARALTWTALKAEWAYVRDIYRGPFLLGSLIRGVLSH